MSVRIKALVENPYYLKNCDLGYKYGNLCASEIFHRNYSNKYLTLDIVLGEDGVYYPYFDRTDMTNIFLGMHIKQLGVK